MTKHEDDSTRSRGPADRSQMLCPNCGHELSMFSEPEPDRGERVAGRVSDRLATWWFPTGLVAAIVVWLVINVIWRPFEPYPMVVLAVLAAALSTIAACQGPLILLSQRRAAIVDRERDRETYVVVTRSESDLHELRAKVDELAALVRDNVADRRS